jgi:hypothetical protein
VVWCPAAPPPNPGKRCALPQQHNTARRDTAQHNTTQHNTPRHAHPAASLKARDWALLLWGLARLGAAPPERWLAAAAASTWHRLRFFGPQDFGNVLWALSRLGAAPGLPWRSRWGPRSGRAGAARAPSRARRPLAGASAACLLRRACPEGGSGRP